MSEVSQVRDPLTPDEAKAQAIDTARDLKSALGIPVTGAWVYLASCNDQGDAPFRGAAAVHYPLAPSRAAATAETAGFLRTLETAGWTAKPDPDVAPMAAEKNGVTVTFEVQGDSNDGRVITVLGECRDITSTKADRGRMEPIPGF